MVDVVERDDGRLIDFGDRARVERRAKPEEDGSYVWVAYEKVDVVDGKHPVLKDANGEPAQTTYTYVWVIRGSGTEAEARAQALALAGG
ncbi:hypothetical protein DYI24_26335 [Rhodopseudomonas sp. BR0C11]|uniref:hypothetical protein n=1 Tax=Rhodopseudomonas sp. BR0C11 TaxID=2269370 RepID=UPI0013E09274|nr:hypothetical protein [Rhodopseudomonas sp. BR0C11]NEV80556.1 hypothetical protein [Rhodopseudomonas sp. BR0C11]